MVSAEEAERIRQDKMLKRCVATLQDYNILSVAKKDELDKFIDDMPK